MYEMKEEYKIGIEAIDLQHQQLFEIAEEAYQVLKNDYTSDKYDSIVEIINKLKDYTVTHFQFEENFMESIGYKRLFTQKIEHAGFIEKISELDLDHMDENQEETLLELLEFLNNWLVSHIVEKDMLIGKNL